MLQAGQCWLRNRGKEDTEKGAEGERLGVRWRYNTVEVERATATPLAPSSAARNAPQLGASVAASGRQRLGKGLLSVHELGEPVEVPVGMSKAKCHEEEEQDEEERAQVGDLGVERVSSAARAEEASSQHVAD